MVRIYLPPTRPSARPSLIGAILGGLAASGGILVANQAADRLGLTELDLLRVLGLTFREPDVDGVRSAGLAWYVTSGGLVVPLLYWLGFSLLGRVGGGAGVSLGLVHYVVSGCVLAMTHPQRPKRLRGKGRPMGGFVFAYGPLEWGANLAGHLVYGMLVGRLALPRVRAQPARPYATAASPARDLPEIVARPA